MKRPYFETVRDIYVRAARELYKAAIAADFETADPAQFIARGNAMREEAFGMWPLTTRQERDLLGLKARAELNTPEGREHRDRIVAKLREQATLTQAKLDEIIADYDAQDDHADAVHVVEVKNVQHGDGTRWEVTLAYTHRGYRSSFDNSWIIRPGHQARALYGVKGDGTFELWAN